MDHIPQSSLRNIALVTRTNIPTAVPNPYYSANPYGLEGDDDDSNGELMEYWRILRRNSRGILIASLAGLVIGFVIGIPMKPVYRAKTSLEVLTINEDFMNMKQANPTTTNDYSYDTSEEQTQAKLLESSELINRVFTKLDPGYRPTDISTTRIATTGWRSWFHLPEPVQMSPRQKLLTKASGSLKVRPTARTRVLEITVDSTEPKLAADFANTLSQEFIAQNMEARWNSTQRTSEWLRRELDDARDRLRRSEDTLQTYARGSGLIFTDETTNVATEKLQQLQQSFSAATADRIAKQSRFELAQNSPAESLADVLNDTALRETQSKINDLRRQIADLTAIYDPEYSKVRRLQAELESLQSAFEASRTDILSRIKTDFQESTRKEKLLAAAYDGQAREVSGQDEKAIQYNILKRDVDSNRQLYDTMLQQMKQASIASAMRASNVRVIDPAQTPYISVFPDFKLNSAIGLFSGLVLSLIVVTIKERADRTLQQPGDVKQWLELSELGTIPSASAESPKALEGRYLSASLPDREDSVRGAHSISGVTIQSQRRTVELITLESKPSLIAEAFRSALTSVLFIGEGGKRPKVLVLTSANPADGKTTVTSNLAIAASEIRLKVLVIDADLRRPRMHKVFNVDNQVGLSDILLGETDKIAAEGFIKETSITNLQVMPAGAPTDAAAHLLYSPNFPKLISSLRADYDMILIDTPPMQQMTDARVVGRLADAVILVARAGHTTRDAVMAAKERLDEDRIPILGTVLNDWNPKRSTGAYYGYRNGGYYQRYRAAETN